MLGSEHTFGTGSQGRCQMERRQRCQENGKTRKTQKRINHKRKQVQKDHAKLRKSNIVLRFVLLVHNRCIVRCPVSETQWYFWSCALSAVTFISEMCGHHSAQLHNPSSFNNRLRALFLSFFLTFLVLPVQLTAREYSCGLSESKHFSQMHMCQLTSCFLGPLGSVLDEMQCFTNTLQLRAAWHFPSHTGVGIF